MTDLPANRWTTFKKLVIFQVKLAFDAVRDLFLSPISFGCALFDIIKNNSDEQSYFKKLMVLGGKTDVWLNLFAQHDSIEEKSTTQAELVNTDQITSRKEQNNADQLFDKIEDLIREQHAKGGLTASAKNTLDSVLKKLNTNPENINIDGNSETKLDKENP
jgi:hypothetical protein